MTVRCLQRLLCPCQAKFLRKRREKKKSEKRKREERERKEGERDKGQDIKIKRQIKRNIQINKERTEKERQTDQERHTYKETQTPKKDRHKMIILELTFLPRPLVLRYSMISLASTEPLANSMPA